MEKRRSLELGAQIEGFESNGKVPLPRGVGARILHTLWDIGLKWGIEEDRGLHVSHETLAISVDDFRGNGLGGCAGLTVIRCNPGSAYAMTGRGTTILELKNGIMVIWDGELIPDEVRRLVADMDRIARPRGLINEDGIRIDPRA